MVSAGWVRCGWCVRWQHNLWIAGWVYPYLLCDGCIEWEYQGGGPWQLVARQRASQYCSAGYACHHQQRPLLPSAWSVSTSRDMQRACLARIGLGWRLSRGTTCRYTCCRAAEQLALLPRLGNAGINGTVNAHNDMQVSAKPLPPHSSHYCLPLLTPVST